MTVRLPFEWLPDLIGPSDFQVQAQQNFEAVLRGEKRLLYPPRPGDYETGSFEDRLLTNLQAAVNGAKSLPWDRLSDDAPPLDSFEQRSQDNMDRLARYLRNG